MDDILLESLLFENELLNNLIYRQSVVLEMSSDDVDFINEGVIEAIGNTIKNILQKIKDFFQALFDKFKSSDKEKKSLEEAKEAIELAEENNISDDMVVKIKTYDFTMKTFNNILNPIENIFKDIMDINPFEHVEDKNYQNENFSTITTKVRNVNMNLYYTDIINRHNKYIDEEKKTLANKDYNKLDSKDESVSSGFVDYIYKSFRGKQEEREYGTKEIKELSKIIQDRSFGSDHIINKLRKLKTDSNRMYNSMDNYLSNTGSLGSKKNRNIIDNYKNLCMVFARYINICIGAMWKIIDDTHSVVASFNKAVKAEIEKKKGESGDSNKSKEEKANESAEFLDTVLSLID